MKIGKIIGIALIAVSLYMGYLGINKVCSLGQITNGLFEVGGQYRRNM